MFFGLLVLFTALTISGVAIYYSVAGLVAIFAAAAVPIIIMGTSLEVGKLITALWLHKNWNRAKWWLKTYLSIAVFVLMVITSMGIFGFLSKAHVDQNLSSDTVTQRIEIIDNKVRAENSYIERQKGVLERLTGQSTGSNDRFNQDIAIEQKKIDDAYKRLEVLDADVKAYTDQGKGVFKGDNIKRGLEVRKSQQAERDRINQQITVAQENINKLRAQINNTLDKNTVEIKTIEKNIFDAQGRIELLIIDQEPLKGQLMRLESEVGPIRYIAEFVYGQEADRNLLEEAVRWVIITIIFVFDPLAVLLLIASQYHFQWRHEEKYGKLPPKNNPPSQPQHTPPQDSSEPEDDDEWFNVRQLDPKPLSAAKIKEFQERERKESQMLEDIARREREKDEPKKTQKLSDIKKQMDENKASMQSQLAKRKMEDFDEAEVKYDLETTVEKKKIEIDTSVPPADEVIDELIKDAEQNQPEPIDVPLDDNARERLRIYEEKDKKLFDQKKRWKNDHPGDTIKKHKEYFVKGIIDRLPWEDYVPKQEEPPMPLDQWNQMIAEAEKEVSKEAVKKKISEEKDIHNERSGESNQNKVQKQRIKPDLTTVLPPNFEMDVQNYVQNEEQNNNSVWKKIKK
jgi:hypothetical protein